MSNIYLIFNHADNYGMPNLWIRSLSSNDAMPKIKMQRLNDLWCVSCGMENLRKAEI